MRNSTSRGATAEFSRGRGPTVRCGKSYESRVAATKPSAGPFLSPLRGSRGCSLRTVGSCPRLNYFAAPRLPDAWKNEGYRMTHLRCYSHRSTERRGAVLIIALVCLVLIAAMGGTLVRWAAMEHKLLRAQESESQARWLAEAGIERAAAQLAANADYDGETWNIDAAQLPCGEAARVRLTITPIENRTQRSTIEVDVECGLEGSAPAKLHKEVVYQSPSGEKP
jgi:hypothetical protein